MPAYLGKIAQSPILLDFCTPLFVPFSLKMSPNQTKPDWESTGTQNLIRYRPSGTYFARFKVGRKPFRKSLKTHNLTTAKLRLRDVLHQHRAKAEAGRALRD